MPETHIKLLEDAACRLLVDAFHRAPIAKAFGMTLTYNENRQAVFHLPYNLNFDHALKGIHGGVFAILIDNAGWFTAAAHYKAWVVTVEFHTRLLEPVVGEDLRSVGKIIRAGNKLAVCEAEVRTKEDRLVATGSGTFLLTSTPLEKLKG